MAAARRILLIGYGNPGRRDDGLGPALAARASALRLPGLMVDSDYQLNVEHASEVAQHDVVIFADAAVDGGEPFFFVRIAPDAQPTFSTHGVAPAGVLALARDLFGGRAEGYCLGMRGYEFNEFGEGLSPAAEANLAAALAFLCRTLEGGSFLEVGRPPELRLADAGRADGV